MLKIITTLFIFLGLSTSSYAMNKLSQKEINSIEQLNLFKEVPIKINTAYDTGSLYLLNVTANGNSDKIYLTKDKQYLIQGNVINTKTGQPINIPVDVSTIQGKEAFIYGFGKDEYFLFTDPQCPYCKRLEAHFPKISDKVKIRVFYFPLSFHEEAKDIALYVMSQKTKEAKMKAMTNTNKSTPAFVNRSYKKGQLEKLEKELEIQMQVASKLNVRGTPSVFNAKGDKVSWVELLQKYGITVN